MQAETTKLQTQELKQASVATSSVSVCETPAERYRLLKLFEIFIEVDKSLKKKANENNQRNTSSSNKTK